MRVQQLARSEEERSCGHAHLLAGARAGLEVRDRAVFARRWRSLSRARCASFPPATRTTPRPLRRLLGRLRGRTPRARTLPRNASRDAPLGRRGRRDCRLPQLGGLFTLESAGRRRTQNATVSGPRQSGRNVLGRVAPAQHIKAPTERNRLSGGDGRIELSQSWCQLGARSVLLGVASVVFTPAGWWLVCHGRTGPSGRFESRLRRFSSSAVRGVVGASSSGQCGEGIAPAKGGRVSVRLSPASCAEPRPALISSATATRWRTRAIVRPWPGSRRRRPQDPSPALPTRHGGDWDRARVCWPSSSLRLATRRSRSSAPESPREAPG